MSLPPIPPWNAAHVLLVHFPIALLIFTPFMLFIAAIFRNSARQFAIAAGIVMLSGTLAAQIAVMSGQAAAELADQQGIEENQEADSVLETHEETAELARNIFAGISILYLVYFLLPAVRNGSLSAAANSGVLLVFMLLTLGGSFVLANAAHEGGELVHVQGILAPLDNGAAAQSAAEGASSEEYSEEADVD